LWEIMPLEGRRNASVTASPPTDHRANRFLAALAPDDFALLEPQLEALLLPQGSVLYEPGDPIRYTYFPHDAIVSLVDVIADGCETARPFDPSQRKRIALVQRHKTEIRWGHDRRR
jgi:hypothetical protein